MCLSVLSWRCRVVSHVGRLMINPGVQKCAIGHSREGTWRNEMHQSLNLDRIGSPRPTWTWRRKMGLLLCNIFALLLSGSW